MNSPNFQNHTAFNASPCYPKPINKWAIQYNFMHVVFFFLFSLEMKSTLLGSKLSDLASFLIRLRFNIRFYQGFKVSDGCCGSRSILMPGALISTEGRNKSVTPNTRV